MAGGEESQAAQLTKTASNRLDATVSAAGRGPVPARAGEPGSGPSIYGHKLNDGEMSDRITERPGANTGSVFIGDPAGLSDDAMVRRPEQMLSSALKYGTTEHLAPHPRQIAGDASIGVPPLRWVYGDHEGNIERLIVLNLQVQDNAGHGSLVKFDPATNEFTDASGRPEDAGGGAGRYCPFPS